ncbi:DUF262 domain-containing protein, partial [Armatimonas sp.]|uniref:DUF262 domain-containing protein n=1 Tax=Armatimonas sp. TaxID=1872638 RepID=UPI00286D200F
MANDIKTEKLLIKDVFERWFCVPEYQRPYVWGKEEVADLLDDISDALSSRPSSEYFLGSIVFQTKLVKSNNGPDFEEHDLLDGQQRLTTCLLLHAVGRDLATHPQLKESCHKAVFQQENEFDGIPERIRIVYDIRPEVLAFIQKYL